MSNRYKEPLVIHESGDKPRYYETALVKDVPNVSLAITHYTKFGDRFDNLSYQYYNTATYWWYIAKANGMVNGSMSVPPGTTLTIPRLTF